jgi:hypothetical protein
MPMTDRAAGRAMALRCLLVAAYLLLAHVAGVEQDPRVAALALIDIVALVLLSPLLQLRPWAWGALALAGAALARLAATRYALTPLLLVPPAIVAFVCFGFARTLVAGQVPLITRMVAAMDGLAPAQIEPALLRYTRRLTLAWAVLLGALVVFNLVLAAIAVPEGLLATAGWPSPWPISEGQWAVAAHLGNYGLLGGFMLAEFRLRQRRFPGRYTSFLHFLRRLAGLGPAFWQGALR